MKGVSLLRTRTTMSTSLPTDQLPRAYEPATPMASTSGRSAARCSAQFDTALSTSRASGHLSTREFNDLTGIAYGFPALQLAVVLERSPGRMAVRIPCRNVVAVENPGFVNQLCRNFDVLRQVHEQLGHNVSPRFLRPVQMQRLDRLLRSLMRGKAGPFMPIALPRILGLLEVSHTLPEPVLRSICHRLLPFSFVRILCRAAPPGKPCLGGTPCADWEGMNRPRSRAGGPEDAEEAESPLSILKEPLRSSTVPRLIRFRRTFDTTLFPAPRGLGEDEE